MVKIKKIIVNYPEDPKVMEELQDRAMGILARALVKKLPPEVIEKIIERLEEDKIYG
ncbi:hypothetical protein NE167_11820 [Clostridium botulinum]|uniref:hypothetical protein n=1 Tax=Clostridium botulinum TaxID=1491 RepID=UPI00214949BF|nr:hypothetical protein [Clostridium botulinum]MCR1177768.1 hypothetical protein [Clostridium botulinum]